MYKNTLSPSAISIVVEGYNESRDLGTVTDTLNALEQQDFPIERMEVIIVGSCEQAVHWREQYSTDTRFHCVKVAAKDSANYYELKNGGAEIATSDIIAFTDSDVRPQRSWVSSIVSGIQNGADVVLGPSLFHQVGGMPPSSAIMRVAASINWGWVMGKRRNSSIPEARGFMDHNVAMRSSAFRAHQYNTNYGRVIASPLLFRAFINAKLKIVVQPGQQTTHHFSWYYWLIGLQFRYGYEVYRLRRLDPDYPNQWITKAGIFEPVVTMIWHMLLDVPRWFRFASLLDTSFAYRLTCLPLLLVMSTIARTAEMAGMYSYMIAPDKMQRWAKSV